MTVLFLSLRAKRSNLKNALVILNKVKALSCSMEILRFAQDDKLYSC
jgi:hypothetical protein